jgi:RNA recognition motif-containing protein
VAAVRLQGDTPPPGSRRRASFAVESRIERDMSTRLYVGNLPYHATEDLIAQHFGTSGEVKSVNLMIDRMSGQSRGFCFVDMGTADAAQKAIDDLNGN